ncbi:hypothetical protein [Fastidiosibacter lacustris]|uniref:hypothetical protein n=1 Tax=Fastidiosibacter lacustris TaxID=2056695 RepID=UPI000E34552C|nr:hypothetical protein [Fastidiosibacter lacustris]
MSNNYLTHLTLPTGDKDRCYRDTINDKTIKLLKPWLKKCIDSRIAQPLPVPDLAHYSAKILTDHSVLIVTVYGPAAPHEQAQASSAGIPLTTSYIVQRSRQAVRAWMLIKEHFRFLTAKVNAQQIPNAPSITTVIHDCGALYLDAFLWLADFERCIAWTWITDKPQLEVV